MDYEYEPDRIIGYGTQDSEDWLYMALSVIVWMLHTASIYLRFFLAISLMPVCKMIELIDTSLRNAC